MLQWDGAATDFVLMRPCPLAMEPHLQTLLRRNFLPIVEVSTGMDGSAWLWFQSVNWATDKSMQVVAFRAEPVLDENGAVASHKLGFVQTIRVAPPSQGGQCGPAFFGAGFFSVAMVRNDGVGSVEVIRATDGAVILKRDGLPFGVSGTKAFVWMDESDVDFQTGLRPAAAPEGGPVPQKDWYDFTVIDFMAAACAETSGRTAGGISNLQLTDQCRVNTGLDSDWILKKCMSGVDYKSFKDNSTGCFQFLDWERKKCHRFSPESRPSSQNLAAIVLYEDFTEGGEPRLRAEYHQTPFEM
ncbi:hypothetical protein DFJ73DRAFT_491458 [Zopfochytrium polystomum]|nr:hypothetical protein DFJ73DRAFT_491458 [Zopfochytrium polystomum]